MARRRPEPSARRPSFEHRAHPKGQRLLYTTRRRSRLLSSASWTVAGFFCANGLKLQLVFPVQSVAPQPRGAVPLVMGVSREPQRCCWFFQLSWPAPECAIHAFIPIVAPIYWLNGVLRASYSAGAPHVRRSTFRKTEVRAASQGRTARCARWRGCGDLDLFGDATEPLADRGSIALRSRRE